MNSTATARCGSAVWLYTGFVFAATAVLFAARDVLYLAGHDAWASWMLAEDGLFEALGATCALWAALAFGYAFFTRPQANHFGRCATRRNLFFALWAVLLLVMFLEEISWGQRLLGIQTPVWLSRYNTIGELNLHNLTLFQPDRSTNYLQGAWIFATLAYLGALPVLNAAVRPLARSLARLALPIPGVALALGLWLGLLVRFVVPVAGSELALLTRSQENAEVLELVCEFLLLAFALETLLRAAPKTGRPTRDAWICAGASVASLLAVVGWQLVGQTSAAIESDGRLVQAKHLAAAGRTAEARRALVEAVERSPNNAQAWLRLGALDLNAGDVDSAATSFTAALKHEPDNAEGHYLLGLARFIAGRHAQAVEQLSAAVSLAPDSADYRQQLGLALVRVGQFDKAQNETAAAVRLAPRRADIHYNHALVLEERGDLKLAIEHLEKALKLAPDFSAAREQLGRLRKALERSGRTVPPDK